MGEEQLRVMQIIDNLDIGGAQEVVRTLVVYLAESDCSPVVCTLKDGDLRQEIEKAGIPVVILPARCHSVLAFPWFVKEMLILRKALGEAITTHRSEILQTHLLRSLDFLVLSLRWKTGVRKVFWTIHNYNFTLRREHLGRYKWLLGPKRLAYRLLYRLGAYWVDGFIAVSDEVRTSILENIGPVGSKITVIANGVDVPRYQQPVNKRAIRDQLGLAHNVRLLIMVGAFKEQKGHRYLVQSASQLLPNFPELHILLVGDGELRDRLELQVEALGLSERIHFLGNRSDVPELLAASDYFVLPSLWEGLPMALIEAMACGLPIVATEVSGSKQVVVSGETGLLVPPGDALQLTEALTRLLSDPVQAREMGAAARRRVETEFSARKQADEHIALFNAQNGVDFSLVFE
jgi:glycosyltransferase involved in cell wall biosynthesis